MNIASTTPVSGASSATPHALLPSSAQHPAAQAPGIGMRSPQAGMLPPLAASGMPAVPGSAPQFHRPAGGQAVDSFFTAVQDADSTKVKRMIQAGIGDLNTIDPATGMSALMCAAQLAP